MDILCSGIDGWCDEGRGEADQREGERGCWGRDAQGWKDEMDAEIREGDNEAEAPEREDGEGKEK